jgi:Chaperone for flagella basal body P-ring formation
MKYFRIVACVASVVIFPLVLIAQDSCRVTVQANVEVAAGEFSLADILTRDTCPEWRRAAARVRLGSAPLAGSARVIEGNVVRALLEKVAISDDGGLVKSANASVPDRVTVRRAGTRASCVDLGLRIFASLPAARTNVDATPARAIDCSAANWLPRETPLELTRKIWDPALGSWDVFARCLDPRDCVPFLLRVPGRDLSLETAQSVRSIPGQSIPRRSVDNQAAKLTVESAGSAVEAVVPVSRKLLVRRGEGVSLLWEQDGIRLVVRAVSLDAGGAGEEVRARIVHGGRTLHAVVVAAGTLRATS